MLQSRFFWKLYAGYVVLILLSSVIVGVMIARQTEQDSLSEIRNSLETTSILLRQLARPSLERPEGTPPDDGEFQRQVHALGERIGTRLTVIRVDGLVQADSQEEPSSMDNHATRPEILEALSHGQGTATRFSETVGTRMMYLALPVESQGELLGYVRASLPLLAIDQRMARLRSIVILGTAVSAAVALLLGFVIARRFTQPLTSMAAVAEGMAEGDYSRRVDITRQDEVGQLAHVLNRMAESSMKRIETINTDRNKLLAILTGMVEGVVAVDQEERVVHMNESAGEILRTAPEESEGQPIWEVTRVQGVCQMLADTLRTKTESKETLRIAALGQDQTVEMHASPLQNSEGQAAGAVLVLHDVSELHRLERVRRDFVANVSHELKTPIAAIRGLVETLMDDQAVTSEVRDRFLAKIQNQSLRASTVVADLLTLSRLESQTGPLEAEPVDLAEVVRTQVKGLLEPAQQRGVKIELDVPKAPVTVQGDERALSQITSNLLDNALNYTPEKGTVWVRLKKADGNALLEVEDTGVGIEPRDQGRIFERFYRVDKGRSREMGGTGLGLAIVKHIALTHGGTVSLESHPGKGSTFTVTLPLQVG
jgi:two-component system phosphate regulon sensor histidine kinase PhoR